MYAEKPPVLCQLRCRCHERRPGTATDRDVLVTATATGVSATNEGPNTPCGTVGFADTAGDYAGSVTTKGYSDPGLAS